jgi:hypothetical protein
MEYCRITPPLGFNTVMRTFPKTFSDLLKKQPSRWPKKGDRLASDAQQTIVKFEPHPISRDAFIWEGYMTAGAALIDETERRPVDGPVLLYPIMFNYRHGLDTAMKWTIKHYGDLANVHLNEPDHDLWSLWTLCKKILVAACLSVDDEETFAVEQIVKDFHDLDKSATALRYSKNKNGATILLPEKSIELGNVQRIMEAVDNFFKGTDGFLSDLLAG